MPVKIEDVCRTCMYDGSGSLKAEEIATGKQDKQMLPLNTIVNSNEEQTNPRTLLELLKISIPQLKLQQNDRLPKNICIECANNIKEFNYFREKCLSVERHLYELLQTSDTAAAAASKKPDDEEEHPFFDMFEKALDVDDEKLMKSEVEEDVFIDQNSFQSDQFVDDEMAQDNEEEFIKSVKSSSDFSIDFELDTDSDSNFGEK